MVAPGLGGSEGVLWGFYGDHVGFRVEGLKFRDSMGILWDPLETLIWTAAHVIPIDHHIIPVSMSLSVFFPLDSPSLRVISPNPKP